MAATGIASSLGKIPSGDSSVTMTVLSSGARNPRIMRDRPSANVRAPRIGSSGSARIDTLLNLSRSSQRHARLRDRLVRAVEFEPRRREDIDMIFLQATPPVARLLVPLLAGKDAGDIPTYTLGDAYEPHPTANEEIEGMLFPDMPWMVGDTSLTAEVRNVAAQAFGDSGPRRGRLFAYGFDAMRLASSLQRGAPIGPDGLTGTLSMDAQGRIRRSLNWVRIKSGAPAPMDATPAITAQ